MTQENQFKGALDVSQYYQELEAGYSNNVNEDDKKGPRLQKLWMNAPPNFGTIQVVLYPSGHNGSYFTHIEGVRGVKFWNGDINENDPSWHRILPKKYYPELQPTVLNELSQAVPNPAYSPEFNALYDEVDSLFDLINTKNYEATDAGSSPWINFLEFKNKYTWNVFFGKLIAAYSLNNTTNESIKGEGAATFFCYPGKMFKDKVFDGLNAGKARGYGDVAAWSMYFFNANETQRNGYLNIVHKLPESGGYDTDISFEFDSIARVPGGPVVNLIPNSFEVTEDDKKLFSNVIIAFMGKMFDYKENKYFNKNIFIEIREYFKRVIADNDPSSQVAITNFEQQNQAPVVDQNQVHQNPLQNVVNQVPPVVNQVPPVVNQVPPVVNQVPPVTNPLSGVPPVVNQVPSIEVPPVIAGGVPPIPSSN